MDSKIIQKRVDDLVKAMLAKGMREPRAQVDFKADEEPSTYIVWKSGFGKRTYGSDDTWKFFRGWAGEVHDGRRRLHRRTA